MKEEQLIGYMSVRGKPSRSQVEVADRAYQLFRDGKAGNLRNQETGKVVKSSSAGQAEYLQGYDDQVASNFNYLPCFQRCCWVLGDGD